MGIFGLVQPCYMGVCTGATTRATHRHGPLPGVQQGRAQGIDGDPGCEYVDQDELATGEAAFLPIVTRRLPGLFGSLRLLRRGAHVGRLMQLRSSAKREGTVSWLAETSAFMLQMVADAAEPEHL